MLSERHSLINDAGFNLNCLQNENASSSAIPTDHPTADVHTKADKLQTMVVAFNVLFDVFKILSIKLHRKKGNNFYSTCPTCTEGWLMKTERQSVIESIREYIPLNDCLIDFDKDPLRFEHIFPSSITFVDTQSGNHNFVHGYMTQVDISRMGSNCDLVPEPHREITKDMSTTQSSSIMNVRALSRTKGGVNSMLARLLGRNLNMQTHRLSSSMKTDPEEVKFKRLQDHLSSDCKYNPFKFCNTRDNEKLRLSSFFMSIQDRSRYQACDRSGTYSKETYDFNTMLLYDYEQYETRHLMNPMNGGNGRNVLLCFPLCREQFDHASKDFCPSWVNWGMNISYDVSKTPMTNKTMFKSGGQCLGGIG